MYLSFVFVYDTIVYDTIVYDTIILINVVIQRVRLLDGHVVEMQNEQIANVIIILCCN
jgi:hypothetical protein